MKKELKAALVFIGCAVMIYLSIAFVIQDLNSSKWSLDARLGFVIGNFFSAWLASGALLKIY